MKKIIQPLIIALTSIVLLASCKKEEDRELFLGGTAPVLGASVSGNIPLSFLTENNVGVKFTWSNPEYQFASGINSQDVNYTIEIDKTGSNFTGANKKSISLSKDLSVTYTQKEFNIVLSDLKLKLGVEASIDVRVVASLGALATKLISNTLKFNVTPFAPPPKVPVPTAGTLWITGDAALSGWQNPLSAPFDVNQKFTKVSDTEYELVVFLNATGRYKLIQENGVWGTQYHMIDGGTAASGSFEKKDADPGFLAPDVAGNYKIAVNFQTGTYTVTKQ